MGLLSSGQSWLQTQMDAEGIPISYIRGAITLSFNACPDGADEAGLNGLGQIVTFGERDWCFPLSKLATLTPAKPAQGDKIRATIGSVVYEWIVQPKGAGPLFDDLDNRRSRIAVHTVFHGEV